MNRSTARCALSSTSARSSSSGGCVSSGRCRLSSVAAISVLPRVLGALIAGLWTVEEVGEFVARVCEVRPDGVGIAAEYLGDLGRRQLGERAQDHHGALLVGQFVDGVHHALDADNLIGRVGRDGWRDTGSALADIALAVVRSFLDECTPGDGTHPATWIGVNGVPLPLGVDHRLLRRVLGLLERSPEGEEVRDDQTELLAEELVEVVVLRPRLRR